MFNTNLAVKVLAVVEETQTPGAAMEWDQTHWGWISDIAAVPPNSDLIYDAETKTLVGTGTCGTGMCFAGWALSHEGVKMRWDPTGDAWESDDSPHGAFVANYTEDGRSVQDAAADMLGIDYDMEREVRAAYPDLDMDSQGDERDFPILFHHRNTIDDLYEIVAAFAGLDEDEVRARVQAEMVEQAKVPASAGPITPNTRR